MGVGFEWELEFWDWSFVMADENDGKALGAEAIAARAAELPAGWSVERGRLVRAFKLADFAQALALVNRIGELAEARDHHPDLSLGWGRVGVELRTHSVDGLTAADFELAAAIEALPR